MLSQDKRPTGTMLASVPSARSSHVCLTSFLDEEKLSTQSIQEPHIRGGRILKFMNVFKRQCVKGGDELGQRAAE